MHCRVGPQVRRNPVTLNAPAHTYKQLSASLQHIEGKVRAGADAIKAPVGLRPYHRRIVRHIPATTTQRRVRGSDGATEKKWRPDGRLVTQTRRFVPTKPSADSAISSPSIKSSSFSCSLDTAVPTNVPTRNTPRSQHAHLMRNPVNVRWLCHGPPDRAARTSAKIRSTTSACVTGDDAAS